MTLFSSSANLFNKFSSKFGAVRLTNSSIRSRDSMRSMRR